ncbi:MULTISPECIES: hypothetical protein [unclassified Streptomyces]
MISGSLPRTQLSATPAGDQHWWLQQHAAGPASNAAFNARG